MNKPPNSMSMEECRDWLAKNDGWKLIRDPRITYPWWECQGYKSITVVSERDHPYPPTLDGAAKAMPEGWTWERTSDDGCYWWAAFPPKWDGEEYPTVRDTGDEILDRYRLAYACVIAQEASDAAQKGVRDE